MDKIPYVHLYTDALGAMQILARGSNAAVFLTLGCVLPMRPDGVKENEVATFTGLSLATVKSALANLQHAGLIECQNGAYKTVRYIEYRKPILSRGESSAKNNFFVPTIDSIYPSQSKSNQSIKSQSLESSTDKSFEKSFQALAAVLLLAGGIRSDEATAFQLLWDEHPDAELHARALMIMRKKADRPNYRYYERVVRSGAIDYDAEKRSDVVEVNL